MRKTLLAALTFLAAQATAQESVFPSKQEREMARMLEPQTVSTDARSFLKSKMKAHGKDMRDLVIAVTTLKYDDARKFAQGIANAPRLDKPAGAAIDLAPAYFTLQDTLRKQAAELVTATEARKPDATHAAFTSMMGTCMSCHNAFLVPMRDRTAATR